MGQKANTLTLKKNITNNLTLLSENTTSFLNFTVFLKNLETLFLKRGVIVLDRTLNLSMNQCFLNFKLFFKSFKLASFNRKGTHTSVLKNRANTSTVLNLLTNHLKNYRLTFINFKIQNLNRYVNPQSLTILYAKFKRFIPLIFARRFNLFIDFLKMTDLFYHGNISAKPFLLMLSTIFKSLSKRSHNKFFFFLKYLFKTLIEDSSIVRSGDTLQKICGIKFIASGRLQGKPRSSSQIIREGSTPTQSFNKCISFTKTHVYTLYGAFGLKMWVALK
jgi:hypothetical protein